MGVLSGVGTVTDDVVQSIRSQADAVMFKADVNGLISAVVGRVKHFMRNF